MPSRLRLRALALVAAPSSSMDGSATYALSGALEPFLEELTPVAAPSASVQKTANASPPTPCPATPPTLDLAPPTRNRSSSGFPQGWLLNTVRLKTATHTVTRAPWFLTLMPHAGMSCLAPPCSHTLSLAQGMCACCVACMCPLLMRCFALAPPSRLRKQHNAGSSSGSPAGCDAPPEGAVEAQIDQVGRDTSPLGPAPLPHPPFRPGLSAPRMACMPRPAAEPLGPAPLPPSLPSPLPLPRWSLLVLPSLSPGGFVRLACRGCRFLTTSCCGPVDSTPNPGARRRWSAGG